MLKDVQQDKWWKLFIDKNDQHKGPMAYDNEESKGHHNAMMSVLRKALIEDAGRPLNFEIYDSYHKHMADAGSEVVEMARERTVGEIRNNANGKKDTARVTFGLVNSSHPGKALEEMFNKEIKLENGESIKLLSYQNDAVSRYRKLICINMGDIKSESLIESNYTAFRRTEIVNGIFRQHYDDIQEAKTDREKIEVIADTVRSLHIGHFYPDGNGRLNMPVVMNKLLQDAGFIPSILPDGPRVFGGEKTKSGLADDIIKGITEFAELAREDLEKTRGGRNRLDRIQQIRTDFWQSRITQIKSRSGFCIIS